MKKNGYFPKNDNFSPSMIFTNLLPGGIVRQMKGSIRRVKGMFKIGCAEKILEVPLFTELYGHGPFHGRCCQGEGDAFASGTPDPEYLKIFGAAMPETEMPFIFSRKKMPENSLPSTRGRKNSSGFMRYCHMLTLEFKFVDTIADLVVKNSLRLEK